MKDSAFKDMSLDELIEQEKSAMQMMKEYPDDTKLIYQLNRADLGAIRKVMKNRYGYDWLSKQTNTYLYQITVPHDNGEDTWHTTASGEDGALNQFKKLAASFLCPESAIDRAASTLKRLKKVT